MAKGIHLEFFVISLKGHGHKKGGTGRLGSLASFFAFVRLLFFWAKHILRYSCLFLGRSDEWGWRMEWMGGMR